MTFLNAEPKLITAVLKHNMPVHNATLC